ncbi:hypothetical protein lerEdw1_003193 [Lerista edwardsae]|nr:hypothetical protein lerEdw1_003193 [Lerista edwardsae]
MGALSESSGGSPEFLVRQLTLQFVAEKDHSTGQWLDPLEKQELLDSGKSVESGILEISRLETELQNVQKMKTDTTDQVQDCQELQLLKPHQEKVRFLERKLLEETEWRKRLAQDLEAMQKTLKGEKKVVVVVGSSLELHDSKSELPRLHSELQRLQEAAEDRECHNTTLEKLQQENLLLEMEVSAAGSSVCIIVEVMLTLIALQVSELSQEYEQLSQLVAGQAQPDQRPATSGRSCSELAAKEKIWEDQLRALGEEKEQLRVKLLVSQKKTEELAMQVKGSHEERQLLREENDRLRQDFLALLRQLSSATSLVAKREAGSTEKPPLETRAPAGDMGGEVKQEKRPPQEGPPCTKETVLCPKQGHSQRSCGRELSRNSVERELRYEREKSLELTEHNALLQQENITMKAERRQVQAKLSESCKECASLTSQCEQSHQQVRELELELLKHSQALKQQNGLQEKLSQEKARAAEAESRHLHCQKYSQKLLEQQLALQKEKEAFHEEFKRTLEQTDVSVRKHHERQLRHKAKLQKAKETFISEVKKRDVCIKELESEVTLVKNQVKKDQVLIGRVAAENKRLLQEKRRLLEQLQEREEAERSSKQVLFSAQNRVELLHQENKQLQERTLQLTAQGLRSVGFSECQLRSKPLPLPNISFSVTELLDSLGLLKAIQDAQPEEAAERSLLSPSSCQRSGISYLNTAPTGDAIDIHEEKKDHDLGASGPGGEPGTLADGQVGRGRNPSPETLFLGGKYPVHALKFRAWCYAFP